MQSMSNCIFINISEINNLKLSSDQKILNEQLKKIAQEYSLKKYNEFPVVLQHNGSFYCYFRYEGRFQLKTLKDIQLEDLSKDDSTALIFKTIINITFDDEKINNNKNSLFEISTVKENLLDLLPVDALKTIGLHLLGENSFSLFQTNKKTRGIGTEIKSHYDHFKILNTEIRKELYALYYSKFKDEKLISIFNSLCSNELFLEHILSLNILWKECVIKLNDLEQPASLLSNIAKTISVIILFDMLTLKNKIQHKKNNIEIIEELVLELEQTAINLDWDFNTELNILPPKMITLANQSEFLQHNVLTVHELLNKYSQGNHNQLSLVMAAIIFHYNELYETRLFFNALARCSLYRKHSLENCVLPLISAYMGKSHSSYNFLLPLYTCNITAQQLIAAVNILMEIHEGTLNLHPFTLFNFSEIETPKILTIINFFNQYYPEFLQHNNFKHPKGPNIFYFMIYKKWDIKKFDHAIILMKHLFPLVNSKTLSELILYIMPENIYKGGNILHQLINNMSTITSSYYNLTIEQIENIQSKQLDLLTKICDCIEHDETHLQQLNAKNENLLHSAMQIKNNYYRGEILEKLFSLFDNTNSLEKSLTKTDQNGKTPYDLWLDTLNINASEFIYDIETFLIEKYKNILPESIFTMITRSVENSFRIPR